jgi:phenylalanyl-tRNA synthetase beta chain
LSLLFGAAVPDGDVERILSGLGLAVTRARDGWDAVVPSFRVDLLREADLIEEVGRHYGFDRLEPAFPAATAPAPPADPRTIQHRLVRRVATAAGLSEAVTFGFIEAATAALFRSPQEPEPIAIANPLSGKFDTLRGRLIPGLVDVVAHNRRHGRRDVRVFEVGTRFSPAGETRALAVAWTGGATPEHWSGSTREVDFYDVKGVIERLCAALSAPVDFTARADDSFLVPGQSASVSAGGARVGSLGVLSPAIADQRGLPRQDRVIVAELDLDALTAARVEGSDAARPLPRYPFVVRDLSIVVPNSLNAEIIRGTIRSAADSSAAPLVAIGMFDRYQGKGVPEGSVSLSFRLTFQSDARTLTDAEVQQAFDNILSALVKAHGAVQR